MKKRLRIIRAMAAMVFILAMMLSMVSCGGSNTTAEEPDGTAPPSASVSPGVATAKPSATVQPGTPVKPTVGGTTSGSTGASTGAGTSTGGTAKPGSTTGTSATETPETTTQPSATPTPSTTQKPESTKTPATPTPTPVPTQKPSKPTPTPTPIPTPFTTPVPATPNPTQGPVKPADPTPTPHVHQWETTTIHHDAVTQEKVIPAHQEGSQWPVWVCYCGAEFTSYDAWAEHDTATGYEHGGNRLSYRNDYHDVPEQTVTEVVTPAWDETITRCKSCGATQ